MRKVALTCVVALVAAFAAAPVGAKQTKEGEPEVPEWAQAAVEHLTEEESLFPEAFEADSPMARADFTAMMQAMFGGGFKRTRGLVKAREVDAALVRKLGYKDLAASLVAKTDAEGWSPAPHRWFGTEIIARELGLRHNREVGDEEHEAAAAEPMPQADVAYAVWRAATSPSTYSAELLETFEFDVLDDQRKALVAYAFSLVGTPYVWAGEWPEITPDDYPYGEQTHGGFDCSGFVWYVMRAADENWAPMNRPYEGWDLPERSSAQMAGAISEKKRIPYNRLIAGDLVFFSPNGVDAEPSTIYHAGIYLGKDWMVHVSGSRAGVSISYVGPDSWWADQVAWGRRIIPKPEVPPPPAEEQMPPPDEEDPGT